MKLDWRLAALGVGGLLVGARVAVAPWNNVLLVAAMGLGLWGAFSLPHPPPPPPPEEAEDQDTWEAHEDGVDDTKSEEERAVEERTDRHPPG